MVFITRTGERAEVEANLVDDLKKPLPTICEGFQPVDIYSMDWAVKKGHHDLLATLMEPATK